MAVFPQEGREHVLIASAPMTDFHHWSDFQDRHTMKMALGRRIPKLWEALFDMQERMGNVGRGSSPSDLARLSGFPFADRYVLPEIGLDLRNIEVLGAIVCESARAKGFRLLLFMDESIYSFWGRDFAIGIAEIPLPNGWNDREGFFLSSKDRDIAAQLVDYSFSKASYGDRYEQLNDLVSLYSLKFVSKPDELTLLGQDGTGFRHIQLGVGRMEDVSAVEKDDPDSVPSPSMATATTSDEETEEPRSQADSSLSILSEPQPEAQAQEPSPVAPQPDATGDEKPSLQKSNDIIGAGEDDGFSDYEDDFVDVSDVAANPVGHVDEDGNQRLGEIAEEEFEDVSEEDFESIVILDQDSPAEDGRNELGTIDTGNRMASDIMSLAEEMEGWDGYAIFDAIGALSEKAMAGPDAEEDDSLIVTSLALACHGMRHRDGAYPTEKQIDETLSILREPQTFVPDDRMIPIMLAAASKALRRCQVHVISTDERLMRESVAYAKEAFKELSISVAFQDDGVESEQRPSIVYGTPDGFGCAYLRNSLSGDNGSGSWMGLDFAIIDGSEDILGRNGSMPLSIKGASVISDDGDYRIMSQLVRNLRYSLNPNDMACDIALDMPKKKIYIRADGAMKLKERARSAPLTGNYSPEELTGRIQSALQAEYLLKRDVDYVVDDGKIVLRDTRTGMLLPGRKWVAGIQQAVESKEGLPIHESGQQLASMTVKEYVGLYDQTSLVN